MQEVHDAIAHIEHCSGDPGAWRRGLTGTEMAVLLPAAVIDQRALTGLLTKIRANHPALFDRNTGVPITPSSPPPAPPAWPADGDAQRGEAAAAMKKAEDDLAQQNSTAAQLDLHVITAILNAHVTVVDGGGELQSLQQDVENAVRTRTDLDTATGARDFQRYLIGKLRQIAAVVENAHLDDTSKAALASAWTALYESSKIAPATDTAPQGSDHPSGPESALPPYGADENIAAADPFLEQLLGDDPAWADPVAPAGPANPAPPPTLPMMSGLPALGGGAAPLGGGFGAGPPPTFGVPRPDEVAGEGAGHWPQRSADEMSLSELLGDGELPEVDEKTIEGGDPADSEDGSETSGRDQASPSGPTVVHLPNGETVTAPSPQIAGVIRAAVGGTPIVEAFRQEGMSVPPPGTAVAHPLDPARLSSGDIGMFTDRQALALDRERALFNGRIQPVASVSGPSFLGWLHPPGSGTTTPSASSPTQAPDTTATPQPTRPAGSTGSTE
ncbi:DUF4226 domain-containing protein [soil metagenome]